MGWFTKLRSNLAIGARLRGMGNAFMGGVSSADASVFNGLRGARGFNAGFDNGAEVGKIARRAMLNARTPGLIGAGAGAAVGAYSDDDHRIRGGIKGGIAGGGIGLAGGVLRNNWGLAKSVARGARL